MAQMQAEIPPKPKERGGAREGAGRKPKALKYATDVAKAEERILLAMPAIIDGLIFAATKRGDSAAGRYLMDRIFGRVKESISTAPAENTDIPYSEEQHEREIKRMESFQELEFF